MVDRPHPAKSLLFVQFFKKFPVLKLNPGETGSYLTAHTTIQSPQTAGFRDDAKYGVSSGIFGYSIPEFLSLQALSRFHDDFGLPVSASRNSVPGGPA
jgi:hypothetical protein